MKTYKKSIIREILSSKARFFSIIVIIFLGVAFYSGIKSAGPDMSKTINKYYDSENLMDSKIISTLGLSDNDLDKLKNNDKILDYYGSRTIDVNLTNMSDVVRFMEYDDKNNINKFLVLEGKLPQNSGEIALDEKAFKLHKNLKIGDEFVIESDKESMDKFKEKKYKIVGKVKSPLYLEKEGRGATTVGKGTVDYFAVLNKNDINMKPYTEIYVRFKNVKGINAYGDEYSSLMDENNKYLENLFKDRLIERENEVREEVNNEFKSAYEEIDENEKLLLDKENELKEGKEKLEDGKATYIEKQKEFEDSIKFGEENIELGEKKLEEGKLELKNKKEEIANGEKALEKTKETLDNTEKEFLKNGINPNENTSGIDGNINKLMLVKQVLTSLSSDIKNTVNSLGEGEKIPSEKIEAWEKIASDSGLDDLKEGIDAIAKNPEDKNLALGFANILDGKVEEIDASVSKLEEAKKGVSSYQIGKAQYEKGLNEINSGKSKILEAENKIKTSEEELNKNKETFKKGKIKGEEELKKAKADLDKAEEEILSGEKSIAENKKKIEEGKEEIDKKKKSVLDDIKECKYIVFDRNDYPGYTGYKDSIDSLDKIASVLPVFFFIVAILICLTTMTRMVEEKRLEIGTMKALGYGDFKISLKFIVYASIASILGCIFGILVGSNVIPNIISNAYGGVYGIPKLEMYYYPKYIIQSLVVSILCTVGAALFVIRVELISKPSELMRPKAPKVGKKILLERITPLWKRLNFNQKVTFRNIFRYKQRMIMTIFGISGCMALLVTGFGLKDSNMGMVEKQFDKVWKYESMVAFNDNSTKEEIAKYNEVLKNLSGYENNLEVYQEPVTFTKEGMNKQTANLYVPKNADEFNKFVLLNNRESGEEYKVSDDGAIISEKLAKLLNTKVGDTITFKDEENNSYEVKVSGISENYMMHFIYMSPSTYKKTFKKDPIYNIDFINFDKSNMNEDEITTKLMECNNVMNVQLTSELEKRGKESADNMNVVMIVIILSAGSLAFVVLYNLNNINVSERIRELSTIKVLGFFDDEVTMYILRENIILTFLGVLLGGFLGKLLHGFIINTSETDTIMMYPDIAIKSYIMSGAITILFSILVMILMHIKLKNVNMIDALKSNE